MLAVVCVTKSKEYRRSIPMTGYFSFQKLITTSIAKVVYALGFLILTAGSVALIVWSGMRLNDANIDRQLGWRYVAIGAAALVVGNLAWRVICEFWIVLFNVNNHLASIDYATSLNRLHKVSEVQFIERRAGTRDRRVAKTKPEVVEAREPYVPARETLRADRQASVLGLS
jgi:hypothetical protein